MRSVPSQPPIRVPTRSMYTASRRQVAADDEDDRGGELMIDGEHVRSPWSSSISRGSVIGHHGEQQDTQTGAEVAAVDRRRRRRPTCRTQRRAGWAWSMWASRLRDQRRAARRAPCPHRSATGTTRRKVAGRATEQQRAARPRRRARTRAATSGRWRRCADLLARNRGCRPRSSAATPTEVETLACSARDAHGEQRGEGDEGAAAGDAVGDARRRSPPRGKW